MSPLETVVVSCLLVKNDDNDHDQSSYKLECYFPDWKNAENICIKGFLSSNKTVLTIHNYYKLYFQYLNKTLT